MSRTTLPNLRTSLRKNPTADRLLTRAALYVARPAAHRRRAATVRERSALLFMQTRQRAEHVRVFSQTRNSTRSGSAILRLLRRIQRHRGLGGEQQESEGLLQVQADRRIRVA